MHRQTLIGVGLSVVVVGGWVTYAVVSSKREREAASAAAGPSKVSSRFAKPDVRCNGLSCTVTMHGGTGQACFDVDASCDGMTSRASRCSAVLKSGETASYAIDFRPPLPLGGLHCDLRVADVKMQ